MHSLQKVSVPPIQYVFLQNREVEWRQNFPPEPDCAKKKKTLESNSAKKKTTEQPDIRVHPPKSNIFQKTKQTLSPLLYYSYILNTNLTQANSLKWQIIPITWFGSILGQNGASVLQWTLDGKMLDSCIHIVPVSLRGLLHHIQYVQHKFTDIRKGMYHIKNAVEGIQYIKMTGLGK